MTTTHRFAGDVSATRTREGAWSISALVGGYPRTRRYYYFTKREAIRAFRIEVNS